MSSGRTHAAANIAVLGLTVIAAPLTLPFPLAVGAITGALLGTITTPDLDLSTRTHEEYRIRKHLGWFIGGLWELFWMHYARTHSHRGSSHAPFVGTWGRWQYVFKRIWWLLAIALYFYGGYVLAHLFVCFSVLFFTFVFHVIQDLTHLALDGWKFHKGH